MGIYFEFTCERCDDKNRVRLQDCSYDVREFGNIIVVDAKCKCCGALHSFKNTQYPDEVNN